ncbi:hypothetical protein [Chitinophaga deserti]|uniref:hypothetical protein n=1 Tax=Chitinophaga deserti TaxID=2164099 RepID=UPI000D6C902D|nr:hypothetical protein [Chitinophaga deserti]
MAILDSLIPFKGRLGNIISYERNGRHCLRSVPKTVRQTDNTRRAAKLFGAASRKGALIRHAIAHELNIFPDRVLVNRLNSYILEAGRNNHAGLVNFRFNGYTGLDKYFGKQAVVTKDGRLHIPPQHMQGYGDAERMELKVIATRIDFSTRTVTGTDTALLKINLTEPFQHFEGADMRVNVPGKGTLLVVLQLQLFKDDFDIRDRHFGAADIIAVVEEQAQQSPSTIVKPHTNPFSHDLRVPATQTVPAQNRQTLIQWE